MSTGKTEFLGLNLWELQDDFNHLEFNADNAAVDAVVKELYEGRALVESGSYVGTGTYGESNPNHLTFGFLPKLIYISAEYPYSMSAYGRSEEKNMLLMPGISSSYVTYQVRQVVAYNGNTVSWYTLSSTNNYYPSAVTQLNQSGTTYYYFAIG